jgi:glycerate 2-kinase
MKIVLAPNAFKESLTAAQAARAMRRGLARALPQAELIEFPVADGGDGTAEVLRHALGGRWSRHRVTGPHGRPVVARLLQFNARDLKTFVIEVADTSGLRLVPPSERDPLRTTTRGLGELIRLAINRGARRIVIGLGGSATVDGGAGMAQALGFSLADPRGKQLPPGGGALERLHRIDPPPRNALDPAVEFIALCDVKNPLLGPRGAARVFGPQKGATRASIPRLEHGLARLAGCWRRDLGSPALAGRAGAGAAGGLGAGLVAFLGAELRPGAAWLLDAAGFDRAIGGADFVITGEGRLDAQTLEDKAPAVVARVAAARGVAVIALAGSVDPALRKARGRSGPFRACFSILDAPMALPEAQRRAAELLERSAFEVGRLLEANR